MYLALQRLDVPGLGDTQGSSTLSEDKGGSIVEEGDWEKEQ